MREKIQKILKSYWGYEAFRPLQEDIILNVLDGKDTLALMPTGGGKSICYQVPALALDGLCIVVSPLIALMKDQSEALQARGIRTLMVYSGLSAREVDTALDNAIYGNYKFLFLSPERLETDLFRERAPRMPVSMIAVDEAHCISEWGYDFRPSYLRLAGLREYFPKVAVLALTASATPDVKEDIQDKLLFKKDSKVFQMSFDRPGLVYASLHEDDKKGRIFELLGKVKGTGIIYVRNRKMTREIATYLQDKGISADFYHAGLLHSERSARQESWKSGETRIMVCTNAFGMGIDKENVRSVIHYELPDSLEAYYQEAGRGGRDGRRAYAMALINESDRENLLEKLERNHPEPDEIRNIYHALGNYFQLPIEAGKDENFDFPLPEFCQQYNFYPLKVHHALRILERAGYISLTEAVFIPSRLRIIVDHNSLYSFEIANKKYEPMLKMILRSYGGCFEHYTNIDERQIASRMSIPLKDAYLGLKELHRLDILDYQPQKNLPQLVYLRARVSREHLHLEVSYLKERKRAYKARLESVIRYAFTEGRCRGKIILEYFGEKIETNCGHCDYCFKSVQDKESRIKSLQAMVKNELGLKALRMDELLEILRAADKSEALEAIRWMIDNQIIRYGEGEKLTWKP